MDQKKRGYRKFARVLGVMGMAGVLAATGCASFSTERGVESRWRASDAPEFTAGSTTQTDVMKALGPPSQIITLGDKSVFYYLREQGAGKGLILLIYNEVRYAAEYDRAIFFFDTRGVLTEYSYSDYSAPSVKIGEQAAKE